MRVALLRLRDAALIALGNPEDCDDCGDLDAAGECRPCFMHDAGGTALWKAVCAAEDALGPCHCGHMREEHDDEYERRCLQCNCKRFEFGARGAR